MTKFYDAVYSFERVRGYQFVKLYISMFEKWLESLQWLLAVSKPEVRMRVTSAWGQELAWRQIIISLGCFANNAIHPWLQVMPIFDREMPPGFTPANCLRRNFVYISNSENQGDKSLDQNF